MKTPHRVWQALHSSLWFVPTLLVVAAVALAVGLIELDSSIDRERLARSWPRLFGAGAEGSRGLLSAIAGSMITVAGVSFSITVVALALASSQYTSRILRNFMRDRANQTVLGVFLGVFAYSLVVLRTVRGESERGGAFVPALAVLTAVLLAFVAIGFLIFFIHHIASSIQARSIVEAAAGKTLQTIDRLFPADTHAPGGAAADTTRAAIGAWRVVAARRSGYLQQIDADALLAAAREHDVALRMAHGVGAFVIEGCALAEVCGAPPHDEPSDALTDALNAACAIDSERTLEQDAAYGIRQIVDVALKALSPGINDTTTAINCIDYLGAILARLAARRIETPGRCDAGRLRVALRGPTFAGLLGEAVDQIRQSAEGNVAVLSRLLQMLRVVAGRTADADRLRALALQAELIAETAERSVPSARDRAAIRRAGQRTSATPGEQDSE